MGGGTRDGQQTQTHRLTDRQRQTTGNRETVGGVNRARAAVAVAAAAAAARMNERRRCGTDFSFDSIPARARGLV